MIANIDPQQSRMSARALWITGPREAKLIAAPLPAATRNPVLVRTLWSGISRGTERLVFEGRVPPSEFERMRAPWQEGNFPYPVKYGYCAVGIVESGPAYLLGQTVFALYPHQERFVLSVEDVLPVPASVSPRRAILTPFMETALNAMWDAGPMIASSIVVVGAGTIGLLIAYLASRIPGCQVTVVDIDPERRGVAALLGLTLKTPDEIAAIPEADCVFHASATANGLETAINVAGFESTIVEVSWYGDYATSVHLGGVFHSRRLKIISSQVSHIAPSQRPRWDHPRRVEKALSLLVDDRLDHLLNEDIAFNDLPAALPAIFAPQARGLAPVVRYY